MEQAVDTNVILRYFVGDNKRQQRRATALFKRAERGKLELLIKPLVVAEACFVLESFYKKKRNEIADVFEVFLSQKWLKVEDRMTMLNLWSIYRKKFHFVDSYLLSWASVYKGKVVSFDKKLLKNLSTK
jgi:predicted nucleic-acid-binding protein